MRGVTTLPACGEILSGSHAEGELEDQGGGAGVFRGKSTGEGSCVGERKFKKRAEIFLKDLGKLWLFRVRYLPTCFMKPSLQSVTLSADFGVNFPDLSMEAR